MGTAQGKGLSELGPDEPGPEGAPGDSHHSIDYQRGTASAMARFWEALLNGATVQEPGIFLEANCGRTPEPIWPSRRRVPWRHLMPIVADLLGHGVVVKGLHDLPGGATQALDDLVVFAVSNMNLAAAAATAVHQLAEAWATQLALDGDGVFAYRIEVEQPDHYEYGLAWCDRLIVGVSGLLTIHAGLLD